MTKKPELRVISGRKKSIPCPICQKPAKAPHTPFCSQRCAHIDLGKWLNGDYSIPAHEAEQDSDLEALIAEAEKDPELR